MMQSIEKKQFKYPEILKKEGLNSSLTYWKSLDNEVGNLYKLLRVSFVGNNTSYRPCSRIIRIETFSVLNERCIPRKLTDHVPE